MTSEDFEYNLKHCSKETLIKMLVQAHEDISNLRTSLEAIAYNSNRGF